MLHSTTTRRAFVIALLGSAVVVVLVTVVLTSSTPNASDADAFTPVAKSLLVSGQMLFKRLDASQLSRVRITPAAARHIAMTGSGAQPNTPVVYESLGGYINEEQIIHDWVGTQTYIPPAQPAYLVRIAGQEIEPTGPDEPTVPGERSANHFLNVIVNAVSGKVIMAFSFN
jgi:hypothetical protein